MSEKSEALRLADFLEMHWCNVDMPEAKAAAELRRLHAENAELRRERDEARRTVREAHEAGTRLTAQRDALLEALKQSLEEAIYPSKMLSDVYEKARAAIARAEGQA